MITASFFKSNGKTIGFRISGHSGYAESGSDIVCAAVSAMTMLTVNNISDGFGIPSTVSVEEASVNIEFRLETEDERGCILIEGLKRELEALVSDYPKNIRVK